MQLLEKLKIMKHKGFLYCPKTGNVTYKGKTYTKKHNRRYLDIGIKYNKQHFVVLSHQFAIYYMTGNCYPISCGYVIDHIDGDTNNNKFDNLRVITPSQNIQNQKHKGYSKCGNKFQSQIEVDGNTIYLGLFNTENEASNAYYNAKLKYHINGVWNQS